MEVDLFGAKTSEKLVAAGHNTFKDIYPLSIEDYMAAGFGAGQAANLVKEIKRVQAEPLRDFLLLGALGIKGLGRGTSKKVLAKHSIKDILSLTAGDLEEIDGIDKMAISIVADLAEMADTFNFLMSLSFNLTHSMDDTPVATGGKLKGLSLVFTGTMSGNRQSMQDQAALEGGFIQKKVAKTTSLLVCGSKVGASKVSSAEKLGVKVITEADYLNEFFS